MTTSHAAAHIAASLLAAAWRENLNGLRDNAHFRDGTLGIDTPNGQLTVAATRKAFGQITPTGPIQLQHTTIDDPVHLLTLLSPRATEHLACELSDAVTGLRTALPRHHDRRQSIIDTAAHHQATTTVQLAQTLSTHNPDFLPCRYFELLAVDGHHLHPCARTRLGWTDADRRNYDLEARDPIGLRFVAARPEYVNSAPDGSGRDIGTVLAQRHPPLRGAQEPGTVLIPVHPWQHRNILTRHHRDMFASGALTDLPHVRMDTAPTASIRTLVAGDGFYLKCSLSIHITSTQRGISPATVHNGPILSRLLGNIIADDDHLAPRIAILPEYAGVSLPAAHPAARDLSCLLRASLSEITQPGELPVPATALPAASPVTGRSIAAELVAASGTNAEDFLHHYTDLLAGSAIHLLGRYGIGIEAHLQNCVPTFINGTPHRIIVRDLGGGRVLLPRLAATGHQPRLHPDSVITSNDPGTVRAKVAYTVFQNHLDAVIDALSHDCGLPPADAWRIVADTVDTIDMPATDREFYTGATVPHKALLTMRLHGRGDVHVPVPNPLART